DDGRWNLTRDDLNHLTAFIGDRLGDPPTWEVVGLDEPLERWLAAPILLIGGNDFPALNEGQTEQLREYVRQGGTLLAIAGCDRDSFRAGFRKWIQVAFPLHEPRTLPADHPVFHALFDVNAAPYELQGVDVGC